MWNPNWEDGIGGGVAHIRARDQVDARADAMGMDGGDHLEMKQ